MEAGQQLAQQFERNRRYVKLKISLQEIYRKLNLTDIDVIKQIEETAAPMQRAGLIEKANAEALAVSDKLRADALKEQQEAREDALSH